MTLRARIAFVRESFWLAAVGLMVAIVVGELAAGIGPKFVYFSAVVGVGLLLWLVWGPLSRRLMRRIVEQHQTRVEAALADGDDEAYRRLLDETDDYYRVYAPRSQSQRTRLRCSRLIAEERWGEALALVGEIDRAKVPETERGSHDNLVAWCCAHAGETGRAVEIARANVDAPADAKLRPYLLGTLGAALVVDGQHAAAQGPLRDSIALGGPRWAQAVRRYYLGEALAGLGRIDEARAEWNESVTIAPKSRWGRRAKERLDAGPPAAYR